MRNHESWNAHHPVGSPVAYWPGAKEGEGVVSTTRSDAWLLGLHTPVVMVDGYPGGIALTHVECRDPACTAAHEPEPDRI